MMPDGPDPQPPPSELQRHIELLNFYRSEIKFESGLIAERVSALLSSQAFLVIAYAGSVSNATLRPKQGVLLLLPIMLTLLGLVLSVLAWPGIEAAHAVIDRWSARERTLHTRVAALSLFRLDSDDAARRELARRSYQGSLFSRRAPFVFIIAWCCFGVLAVRLYLK